MCISQVIKTLGTFLKVSFPCSRKSQTDGTDHKSISCGDLKTVAHILLGYTRTKRGLGEKTVKHTWFLPGVFVLETSLFLRGGTEQNKPIAERVSSTVGIFSCRKTGIPVAARCQMSNEEVNRYVKSC